MIAPAREPRSRSEASHAGLSLARRAVAAALFRRSPTAASDAPQVANWLAWLLVAWAAVVATAYFALNVWWTMPRY